MCLIILSVISTLISRISISLIPTIPSDGWIQSYSFHYCSTSCRSIVTQAAIKQPPLPSPPQQNIVYLEIEVSLHPNLVQAPQVAGSVQLTPIGPHIPPPVVQPEVLPGFQLL